LDDSSEPAPREVDSAIAEVSEANSRIRSAALDFRNAIHASLTRDDLERKAAAEVPIDSGLPEEVRESLFAIRAHLAGAKPVLEMEDRVWDAIGQARRSVETLESLAAWANRVSAPAWDLLLEQSDCAIDRERNLENEAWAVLPAITHGETVAEATFPALSKNMVVRLRGVGISRYLQEVWRREPGMNGSGEVRRTVTLMVVDPGTGAQSRLASSTKYYPITPGGMLEEVFDEYASQELIVAGIPK